MDLQEDLAYFLEVNLIHIQKSWVQTLIFVNINALFNFKWTPNLKKEKK
jgi:hypothetical protein